MKTVRRIELLAPAKNVEIGQQAILHGADAVYIGAPRFGARSTAGNSIADLARLIDFAHRFDARVYITLNTILRDDELRDAERLIHELYKIESDALIVQDMGITRLDIPPIALHASTQADNRTPEKVKFLEQCGFSQVVLARELSLGQINEIARSVQVPLEVFVHGALCVSYSGQCYLSEAMCGRSANRGECAQYCRLPYTLIDGKGNVIAKDKHLLSLRDLNQSDRLEELLDAGVSSFKIEGRLKDMAYVKNCTAYYRQELDKIFKRRPEYRTASTGYSSIEFTPQLEKSFNRGFTHYFLDGRTPEPIASPDTPKSLGEYVGKVKQSDKNTFTIAGLTSIHNGDGLCFANNKGEFEGVRVNRVEGNRIFPASRIEITPHTVLYRNFDFEFDKRLSRPSADRRIDVEITLYTVPGGYALYMKDECGNHTTIREDAPHETARTPQQETQKKQLGKLGTTAYSALKIDIDLPDNFFIPASVLSKLRQKAVESLDRIRRIAYRTEKRQEEDKTVCYPQTELSYLGNVSNRLAEQFYREHGVTRIDPAFEIKPSKGVPLMFTRHCIRHMLGICKKTPAGSKFPDPLTLLYKGQKLQLHFDCTACEMTLYKKDIL